MNRARFIALVATLSLCSIAVGVAAPRTTPPPSPFVPEVIYPYRGSQSYDLRLSNAAGTAAVLLHRGKLVWYNYDLAPASRKMATFVESDANNVHHLKVKSWTTNDLTGAITVGPERILVSTQSIVNTDFSPTGDQIAFTDFVSGNTRRLKIVDVASGSISTVATVESIATMRWSHDGAALYYAKREQINGVDTVAAYRQPITGGPPEFMFREGNIEPWDISRDGTDGLIFPFSRPGWAYVAMGKWNGSHVSTLPFTNASSPHYSCGNNRLIYRSSSNGRPGPVKIHTFATNSDVVFSKDQNIFQADFMPCG